jgi:proteasome activator subunit 4
VAKGENWVIIADLQLADHWAQEETRNYPTAQHIDFILSIAQVYGLPILEAIRPIIEAFMAEMDTTKIYDRHKIRAIFELLSGLLRGSEEWPGKDRAVLWDWITPKLPDLFGIIRHDTTK